MIPTFAFLTGPEIAIIVGIAVLLFGADRIPKLARSMGEAKKEFESAQRGAQSATPPPAPPSADPGAAQTTPTPPPPTQS